MRGILVALSGAFLCVSAPVMAQSAEGGAKTVQLSKVILDTQSAPIKGKIKGGTLCVFPSKWDVGAGTKKSQDYERYDVLFSGKLKTAGYNVVTVSSEMFASESDKNRADFLVGATIRPDTINLCSSVNGEKGNVTLSVDWQVYDRAGQKVVATITTTGYAVQEKFSREGLTTMWNQAFTNALGALSDQGVLQAQTGSAVPVNAAPPVVPAAPASTGS